MVLLMLSNEDVWIRELIAQHSKDLKWGKNSRRTADSNKEAKAKTKLI
ncbi:hypothetical protein PE36_14420 [Moritella sp. PE36]|nr:hypothetical protein PE36_14420 [Moritella sp. PE36]